MQYNVSKRESAKLGIARVPIGGSSSGSSKGSSSASIKTPKLDYSGLENLQKQYSQYVSPTQQEIDVNQQLGNLVASKEMGLQGVSEQPIATPFIAGQQKAVTNRAYTQSLPLTAQLQALQAKRQAAADILKTNIGSELQKLGLKQNERDFMYQSQMDAQRRADQLAAQKRAAASSAMSSSSLSKMIEDYFGTKNTQGDFGANQGLYVNVGDNPWGLKPLAITPGVNAPKLQTYINKGIDPNPLG